MAKGRYGDQNGRNPSPAQQESIRRARLSSNAGSEQPNWGRINEQLVHAVITYVTPGDGAVRFGYSRDGGAYAVGIYGDGEPYTTYFHSDEEITQWLGEVVKEYSSAQ